MPAFLLTWNPDKWSWAELPRDLDEFRRSGVLVGRWSCGRSKSLISGDRVFFLKQGSRGRGIYASGYVQGGVFEEVHFADPSKLSRYVTVAYDVLLDPSTGLLQRDALNVEPLHLVNWGTQGGGIRIAPEAVNALEALWAGHVRTQGLEPQRQGFPDDEEIVFPEGATREITVKAFERSAAASALCKGHRVPSVRLGFRQSLRTHRPRVYPRSPHETPCLWRAKTDHCERPRTSLSELPQHAA